MSFGEPNPCSVDKANGFMVEQGKKTPSMWNRVKYGVGSYLTLFHMGSEMTL